MSSSMMMNFRYCYQCEQMVKESVCTVRWYEMDFCDLRCLNKFFYHNIKSCFECNGKLLPGRVYTQKSVSVQHFFCSTHCLEQHNVFQKYCSFCAIPIDVGKVPETKSLRSSAHRFCSQECLNRMRSIDQLDLKQREKCSQCDHNRNEKIKILLHGEKHSVCSKECYNAFENGRNVALEMCHQCLVHFKHESNKAFLISDKENDKLFCSQKCMVYHLNHDDKMVHCSICNNPNRYYETIRSSYKFNNVVWCSLHCASYKGKRFAVPQNDRHFSLFNVQDVQSEIKQGLHDAQFALPLLPEKKIKLPIVINGEGEQADQFPRQSLTRYTITPKTKEEVRKQLKERATSFDQKCCNCLTPFMQSKPFLRWISMEFCDSTCFKEFLKAKCGKCSHCQKILFNRNIGVNVERIGNEIHHFCSVTCKNEHLRSIKLCEYCQRNMLLCTPISQSMQRFCSVCCHQNYEDLHTLTKKQVDDFCTECNEVKSVKTTLFYENKLYSFCSYACFFYLKFSCGIYSDKCIICDKYFLLNPEDTYIIRHEAISNILCSKLCMTHYIRKYRFIESCCFCTEQKYNFTMLKVIGSDLSREKIFCNIRCLDLYLECKEAENSPEIEAGSFDAVASDIDDEELANCNNVVNGVVHASNAMQKLVKTGGTDEATVERRPMKEVTVNIPRVECKGKKVTKTAEKENEKSSLNDNTQPVAEQLSLKQKLETYKLEKNLATVRKRLLQDIPSKGNQINGKNAKKMKNDNGNNALTCGQA